MKSNIFENQELLTEYLELYISRFTHSSLSLNPTFGDIDDAKNIFRLQDQATALKKLFQIAFQENRDLTEEDIIDIANTVNKNSMDISNGYRKIGHTFADTEKPIASPETIPLEMKRLLYLYKTEWKDLPILEKVTKFHMRFFQIHPFEDGNGRTARMILSFQLLREGCLPFIITKDKFKEYHEALFYDKEDVILKIFEEQLAKEEQAVRNCLEEYEEERGPKR